MTASPSIERKTNALPVHVLRNRNFCLLWMGEGISLLRDQFYLIALACPFADGRNASSDGMSGLESCAQYP